MDWKNISAKHWQPALNNPGEIVTDINDIDQCIRIILTTPKGSDPHRPEFGSNIYQYIDQPLPKVIPHLIREIIDAISLWETRAQVISSSYFLEDDGHLRLTIKWQPTDETTKTFTTEVTL